METATINTQITIIHNSIELFRSAPEILKANQERTAKAKAVGNSILSQWNAAWDIKDEDERLVALAAADERSNKYLVNCAGALKEEKEARAAITQMMDAFKKMFTEAETELDRTKVGTVTRYVQDNRDVYVTEVARIQEQKRKEAERIAAKAKEAIEIKAQFENGLNAEFNAYLLSKKQKLTAAFNNLKLEGFADDAAQIRTYQPKYSEHHFQGMVVRTSTFRFHTDEELNLLHDEVKSGKYERFATVYEEEMTALKQELKDKITSKHEELKEAKRLADEQEAERKRQQEAEAERQRKISEANAQEKERLEKEAAEQRQRDQEKMEQMRKDQEAADALRRKRELEEEERMEKEAAAAREKQAMETESKKLAEQTMVMFDQEVAISDGTPTPEARQGYDIVVLHPAGYVQIFTHYFENEGKNLPVDKLGNTKLDQMKAWAEKHAQKTGEKIESKFLRYDVEMKAVNRKAK